MVRVLFMAGLVTAALAVLTALATLSLGSGWFNGFAITAAILMLLAAWRSRRPLAVQPDELMALLVAVGLLVVIALVRARPVLLLVAGLQAAAVILLALKAVPPQASR